jgi:twitching motility protein PilU
MEREQAQKFMHELLRVMLSRRASDLFITAGFPPAIKVDGKLTPVSNQTLTPQHTIELTNGIMTEKQQKEFEATQECNFALHVPNIGRFRVNAFIQQQRVGMVLRTITTQIPKFD